ncbi:MAG: hypothetical protein HZA94_00425 [Candidatus Vogelbacteria bacterium]|nr:hypothetical protein [Candidatus Vogelbacteria bacterium]
MGNLREALVHLEKFLGMNIDCDSLLLFYGACQKVGVDLNRFMMKLSANPALLKDFDSILSSVTLPVVEVEKPVSTIFHINRSTIFDPVSLLGAGSGFWKGSKNGNGRRGALEQNPRSLALTEIDLATVQFKSYLLEGDDHITGEKRFLGIKASKTDIPFDAQTGQSLYEEEGQKSLRWFYDNRGITWFECFGQTLRGSSGSRYSLVLCRLGAGSWDRHCNYLGFDRYASHPAAVVCKPA